MALPHSSQVKEEGWWLVLADAADAELLALKRLSFSGERATTRLTFPQFADADGAAHSEVVLRLVSDSYLGLDQTFRVALNGGGPGARSSAAENGNRPAADGTAAAGTAATQ